MKLQRLSIPLIVPLLLILAACTSNPFKTAETGEQKSDALYGSYVIAKEQGATLLGNPSITDSAKRPLAELMVASKPVADSLQNALIEYSTVRSQLAAGTTSEERLLIAQQNVDEWTAKASPLINQLIEAVGGLLK